MTYCVGILVEGGLVMVADTRTNAGVDNISLFRKLHVLDEGDNQMVVAASAGNLSVTQTALSLLKEGLDPLEEGASRRRIADAHSMFAAAQLVGEALRKANDMFADTLEEAGVSASVSLLLGGRIKGGPLTLYLIYDIGNFIECRRDCPFLQIGESKYGKPILDRALKYETELDEAVKVALISFDSTIRSNLAVGRPIDLMVMPNEATLPIIKRRIEADDAYFNDLSARWSMLLSEARATIPDPPFMRDLVK
jgi:putative proteasome-type protease